MYIYVYGNVYVFSVFMYILLINPTALMKIDLKVSNLLSYSKRKILLDYHNPALPAHCMWDSYVRVKLLCLAQITLL